MMAAESMDGVDDSLTNVRDDSGYCIKVVLSPDGARFKLIAPYHPELVRYVRDVKKKKQNCVGGNENVDGKERCFYNSREKSWSLPIAYKTGKSFWNFYIKIVYFYCSLFLEFEAFVNTLSVLDSSFRLRIKEVSDFNYKRAVFVIDDRPFIKIKFHKYMPDVYNGLRGFKGFDYDGTFIRIDCSEKENVMKYFQDNGIEYAMSMELPGMIDCGLIYDGLND